MAIDIVITCDKCEDSIPSTLNTLFTGKEMTALKQGWNSTQELILCDTCVKGWQDSFKKTKKDAKEKYLKGNNANN